jgi:twitching motility protein PilT
MVNPAIRNLIREGKTHQIFSAILSGAAQGSVTMDNALLRLVRAGRIDAETARAKVEALQAEGDSLACIVDLTQEWRRA